MLTYQLEPHSGKKLYEQLYSAVKADITAGALAPGERLPSKRTFAKNLGVSVITVETAYAQLAAEGFVRSEPQRGFFVEDVRAFDMRTFGADTTHGRADAGAANSTELGAGGRRSTYCENPSAARGRAGAENPAELGAHGEPAPFLVDFASNETPAEQFPFSVWARLVRGVLSTRRAELMANPPAQGAWELRAEIARHLRSFRGMDVSPEHIVVGAGTEYLYGLLIQLFGFDRTFGVEEPGHRKIRRVYQSFGVRTEGIPLDKSGVTTGALRERGVDIIHISPSHQFPTGIVMPAARRYELLEWAAERPHRFIIEDDYDAEFRFSGRPIPTLQSIAPHGNVVYLNTFTKTLASTIRISYMVLPPHLAATFRARLGFYSCTVPTIEQFTLAAFIREGFFERHINRMRKNYHTKRDLCMNLIEENDTNRRIDVLEEHSGLHFLIRLNDPFPPGEFAERLRAARIRLLPLAAYYEHPPADAARTFIVNYGAVPEADIERAVKAILS